MDAPPSYDQSFAHPVYRSGPHSMPYPPPAAAANPNPKPPAGPSSLPYPATSSNPYPEPSAPALYPTLEPAGAASPPPYMAQGPYPAPPPPANFAPHALPPGCMPPVNFTPPKIADKADFDAETLNKAQILAAFEQYATKKSWFFNRPNVQRDVEITDFSTSFRVRYKLESFVESRKLVTRTEKVIPPINPAVVEPITDLFAYELHPDKYFSTGDKERVLHSTVEKCNECFGMRNARCKSCDGVGKEKCPFCKAGSERCQHCNQTGHRTCFSCHGSGSKRCDKCNGHGALRYIKVLVASYTLHPSYHFEGPSVGVPDTKLEKVTGLLLYQQEQPRLQPLPPHPEYPDVYPACINLLHDHHSKFGAAADKRILAQRHTLVSVPVTAATAKYKKKPYQLWVFGKDRKIHCPDYGSCSIL